MPGTKLPDIRMLEREKRRLGKGPAAPAAGDLPDLAANVAPPPAAEELEKLGAELASDAELRARRIERFIKEGPLKPVPRAIIPVSENDL